MNRAHKSQLREAVLQLAELRATVETVRQEAGEGLSPHEDISTARAIASIKAAIINMQGAI